MAFPKVELFKKNNGDLTFECEIVEYKADNGGSAICNWNLYYHCGKMGGSIPRYTVDLQYSVKIGDDIVIEGVCERLHSDDGFATYTYSIASGTFEYFFNFNQGSIYESITLSTYDEINGDKAASGSYSFKSTSLIASQVIVPDVNIGVAPSIIINNFTDAVNTLTYTFGGHGGTIVEKTSKTLYEGFTYPHTFYAEIPNAKYGIGVITCETYYKSGGKIGTSHAEFRVNANEASSAPTIFPTIKDVNAATVALTGDNNVMVRHMSVASVDLGVEARNYATIKSQICANGGKAITTPSGTINGVEQAKFSLSATDSRGFTTSVSMTKPFIEYILPTSNLGNTKPDTAGNMSVECSGSYWNGNFGAAANTLVVQYRYKAKGGTFGEWRNMSVSISGNSYEATADVTGLDYRTTYIFQTRAIDKLNTAMSVEADVVTLPVFHWSESDFVFEVPVTFKQGAEGLENAESTAGSGEWTPELDTTTAVKTYEAQRGWYSRVGNVVTVGFNIKATCNSGHNTEALTITGLPFSPAYTAFGGGVMFGAYVSAGFCFEAWACGTDGNITPRLQPCNNTSAGNLQISSTAYYPSGANSITLGGTITYLTND